MIAIRLTVLNRLSPAPDPPPTIGRMLSYNVADLLRSAPGSSERFDVALTALTIADELELARPVRGEVRFTHSGRSILVQGHLSTVLAERCSRCLRPAEAPLSIDFEDEALPVLDLDSGAPIDISEQPELLRLTDNHELDLEPAIRDAISLAEPIAALCRPDCPGLCETCGLDLTLEPGHRHSDDDIDPRLAVLAGIRDRLQ
jgi:uncharacterized protein